LIIGKDNYSLPIGKAFPMRIIAEIVNASTLNLDTVKKRARYFYAEGANIIDIGMIDQNRMMVNGISGYYIFPVRDKKI